MKMAFNGCDTDGPHNKRLCTGQNSINVNDNNNNTNGSGLLSNGTSGGDVDMTKGLGLLRVIFNTQQQQLKKKESLRLAHMKVDENSD